ncbi:MAG: HlyD family efflux transporter periplasmic adaptor subunit [Bacteroidetes bacterium]|nr:HlyD family efflux transporter periplasmic adaptor subunit [Bacteroidota bacterium]
MNKGRLHLLLIVIGILAISIFAMSGLSRMKKETKSAHQQDMKRYVKARKVEYDTIATMIEATGRLESKSFVDLSAEVQGMILAGNVPLKKGQKFLKGTVLVRIYDKEAVLNLKAAKSRFLTSLANILPDLNIDFPENYASWMSFFEQININNPLPDLPEIKSAKEKIFVSSRNILADYFTIQSTEIRLSKYTIHAPFNGVYTHVYAEVGAVANPGIRLATIIRTDELELEVPIGIDEIKWLKVGSPVIIRNEEKSKRWAGVVSRISDFVDAQTQSISVFVKILVDKNKPLFKGQYLRAEFTGNTLYGAMEISRKAVFDQDKVYTIENGKLKKRTIQVLKIYNKTLLFAGIRSGTLIVTEALINPVEGSEVEILE